MNVPFVSITSSVKMTVSHGLKSLTCNSQGFPNLGVIVSGAINKTSLMISKSNYEVVWDVRLERHYHICVWVLKHKPVHSSCSRSHLFIVITQPTHERFPSFCGQQILDRK